MSITPDSLLSLEAYALLRPRLRPQLIAHRRLRSLRLGEHLTLQFEDERTVRYQIQEMLRIERTFERQGILDEIEAYAPLVPDGSNWKATLLIEYADAQERRSALKRLVGVESRLYVSIGGGIDGKSGADERIYAIADEDGARGTVEKTSAVHFLRFEFTPIQCAALCGAAMCTIGCDHPHYTVQDLLTGPMLRSLQGDLLGGRRGDLRGDLCGDLCGDLWGVPVDD